MCDKIRYNKRKDVKRVSGGFFVMERTIHTNEYYTCMEHLMKVFDKRGRQKAFKAANLEEYKLWKEEVRGILWDITGLKYMETCALEPQLIETTKLEGMTREKMLIQVEPDVWMPFYILIPDSPLMVNGKKKVMLAPHGHSSAGKYAIAGRDGIPAVEGAIQRFNYAYGLEMAKKGYVVFCPDSRGFGERREKAKQSDKEEDFLTSTCFHLAHMAFPLGETVVGMCTWDLMRLIDYIETREDLASEEIGCVGFSGGGMQSLWLAAMDERIKYTMVSGYFYGYKDSLLELNGNCSCNYVPHLWEYVDMGDIGALIAPRPLMIESGTKDHLNGKRGIENVTEQVDITRKAYALFGKSEQLVHHIGESEHRWQAIKVDEFLAQVNEEI